MPIASQTAAYPCHGRPTVVEYLKHPYPGMPKHNLLGRFSSGYCAFWDTALRPEPPFTGVSGPSGPEIAKKSQKGSFWGSGEKSQKIPEKVQKYQKNTQKGPKIGIFRLFRVFLETFLQIPKRPFLRLFLRFRARSSEIVSCKWRLESQIQPASRTADHFHDMGNRATSQTYYLSTICQAMGVQAMPTKDAKY